MVDNHDLAATIRTDHRCKNSHNNCPNDNSNNMFFPIASLLVFYLLPMVVESSYYKRHFSCGGATAKVWVDGNKGATSSILIYSPRQDINGIDVQARGKDPWNLNWDGIPVSNYLYFSDREYNGPTKSYRRLPQSGGWSYGRIPATGTVWQWRFKFWFENGTSCWTYWY